MKTYIFIDTNILDIPTKKRFSEFTFSLNYFKLKEFINEYILNDNLTIIIPQMVLDELLEHYKTGYKAKTQSCSTQIDEINFNLGDVLKNNLVFRPKYSKREYNEFILKSYFNFIKNEIFIVGEYPDAYKSIISRAIMKKEPFKEIKRGGKAYKDAGFKDVIIWETIRNYSFDIDDLVILYSGDGDFNEEHLKKEIRGIFKITRSLDDLKNIILERYNIDEEIYEYKKYINGSYFKNQLSEQLITQYFISNKFTFQKIEADFENAIIERTRNIDGDKDSEILWEGISIKLNVKIFYLRKEDQKKMYTTFLVECDMNEREIELISYEDEIDLEKGNIISKEVINSV